MREGLPARLFERLLAFDDALYRNITTVHPPQDLFDDLSDDPRERAYAALADTRERQPTAAPFITRPFDYGVDLAHPFTGRTHHATRFSDGTRYGVWYGALEVETTVRETVYHWLRRVQDSFPDLSEPVAAHRRVYQVRCGALLVDLREKHREFPGLTDPDSYTFTHRVGRYLHEQKMPGLLVQSARGGKINAAIFTPDVLSNPRDVCVLRYRWIPGEAQVSVERSGRTWMTISPRAAA